MAAEFLNKQPSYDASDANFTTEELDELLSQLTQEELDELNGDFDPDNSYLPASERMRPQTTKDATGPFNRKKLLAFLEKKAKEEKDWENIKSYVKKEPANPWKPKVEPKKTVEEDFTTEWDDLLEQATEDELVDLAAVLGFHGMLNQTQFYASENNEKIEAGGFDGVAKCTELKAAPFVPPNTTDVEDSIKKLQANDSSLKHLNLNNIKNISLERLEAVCETLKTNTNLENLEMASVAMTDRVAKKMAECLKENKTLRCLNIESNFITGEFLVDILAAINVNKTCTELRAANQKQEALGNKVEMKIIKLVQENDKMMKLGLAFEFPETRVKVTEKLQANYDQLRKDRVKGKGSE